MTTLPVPSVAPLPITISMIVEKWGTHQTEQLSPVHRFHGFPWRLRLYQGSDGLRSFTVVCEKSRESELWECTVLISGVNIPERRHTFYSWDKDSQQHCIRRSWFPEKSKLELMFRSDIGVVDDWFRWRVRLPLNPFDPRDAIIVIGAKKEKIHVNKRVLASQSPFFDRLFFGDFKEKNMKKIAIGAVEHEEFCNMIMMVYGFDGARLDDANVLKVLELADRFDLKIVEDRVVSYLLSSTSSFPVAQKILLSEQYNIPFLKDKLMSRSYTNTEIKELSKSEYLKDLPVDSIIQLFQKFSSGLP